MVRRKESHGNVKHLINNYSMEYELLLTVALSSRPI